MSATNTKSVTPPKTPLLAEPATGNCFWIFHPWAKWQTFAEGEVQRRVTGQGEARIITVGYWLRQRRICPHCGLEQLRFEEKKATQP